MDSGVCSHGVWTAGGCGQAGCGYGCVDGVGVWTWGCGQDSCGWVCGGRCTPPMTATAAGGMHLTGVHTCFEKNFVVCTIYL